MDKRFYTAWFDGSTNPNTQRSGIGGYILTPENRVLNRYSIEIPYEKDSRKVEYQSLIELCNRLLNRNIYNVEIKSDFKGLCDSINFGGSNRHNKLPPDSLINRLHKEAKELLYHFNYYIMTWVPRSENKVADKLSKGHLDAVANPREIKITNKTRSLYRKACPKSTRKSSSDKELDYKIQRCIDLGQHIYRTKDGIHMYLYYHNLFRVKDNEIVDIQKMSKSRYFVSESKKQKHYEQYFIMVNKDKIK